MTSGRPGLLHRELPPARRHGIQRAAVPALIAAVVCATSSMAQAGDDELPLVRPRHVTQKAEQAIERGLDWLAARQNREGFWSDDGTYGGYPVAMTSLAGLALLASGSTPTQGEFAPQLSKAVDFLLGAAHDDGLISRGGSEATHAMYGHGFGMLFLAQVYGMEDDVNRQRRIHTALRRAVRLTDRAQSRRGGWYYTPTSNFDEGSVTVTQIQGLRACRNAGIAVPKQVIDDAMRYLEKSALPDGGIAYRVGMTQARAPITAAAVVCWFNAGQSDLPLCHRNIGYCIDAIGARDSAAVMGHYFYAHFYMAQAMYLSGDQNWDKYYPTIRDALLAIQRDDGSWDRSSAGAVYSTNLAMIVLQLPYQYLPIMQR